ncbi:hypothetical protein BN7_5909 [Wickerhamomyces ciferrii]|uniref:Uncharacterized protein n=1 Tax=Wickerhamomyces ciferrii (strain ATCC 14091 / BCRC 22168 / CBS 111 / JCM 3599 / NBRC 0793 / NRRL Y-1031 F-60-10) TaxID=1206466 RepID=K0KWG3_WICCF|nr:uncharacterized protein BN7_5909 [Wickerhamomyces ciferrii]CCH46317.1 hypothetical protein BN7_5909 [Wickerhamomyces ciferrii]
MRIKQELEVGTATDFNFVPPNHNHNHSHLQNNSQQNMYAYSYQTQSDNESLSIPQYPNIMSIPEDPVPFPQSFNITASQPTAFPPPQTQFYQQHSYSQPELQHISQFDNDLLHDNKQEEEITIESLLEDDPLLSFTTTLDRQESNDTILQSSSPIKEPMEPMEPSQHDMEPLNLNQGNIQQNLTVNTTTTDSTSPLFNQTTTPLNSFPTPANSTPSTVPPLTQSPNGSQSQFQNFPVQIPSSQSFQPPQAQFMTFSNNSNSSLSQSSDEALPVNNKTQQSKLSTSSSSSSQSQLSNSSQQIQPQIPTTPTFRVQLQNTNVFHPYQQQQAQFQIQQPTNVGSNAPAPSFQSQQQQFFISRPSLPQHSQSEIQLPSRFKEVTSMSGKQKRKQSSKSSTPITSTSSKDMKLPPTPPAQKIQPPPLNKSSSTTKLNRVKKSSVSGPSTSTLKLKKSKSFLNTTPVKEPGPMFATLDFSKKIHNNSTNIVNAKESKLLKNHSSNGLHNGLKGNVIKNYEFVMEPGREKIKGGSASSSVKSTPRRPSNVGTPTSATSMKFPKLPKPPPIEPTSFSIYSPSNTNSSPTGSDASGHSPLTSAPAQYPFINQSPIPSTISRFDSNDSTSFTADQFLFGSANRKSKRSSISQHSPEKDQSPTVKSGINEFQFRINK